MCFDVLFVNAGVTWAAPFADIDEQAFDGQVTINFKGPFFTVQKSAPIPNSRASVILNTSKTDGGPDRRSRSR